MLTPRTRLERLEAQLGQRSQAPEVVCVLLGAELTPEEEAILARPGVLTLPPCLEWAKYLRALSSAAKSCHAATRSGVRVERGSDMGSLLGALFALDVHQVGQSAIPTEYAA